MMMIVSSVTMLCVSLSLLLTISAAAIHDHQQLQVLQLDIHPALPRKLIMVNKKGEDFEAKALVSSNEPISKPYSGKSPMVEEVKVKVHAAAKGTRQEWIEEGSDPTHEFFTMDYSHVKRRRPIHNKSSPMTLVANSP